MRRNTSGSIELTFKCHWWPPPPPQQDAWLGRDAPRTTLYTRLLSPPTPPPPLSLCRETVEQVLIFHAFRETSNMEIYSISKEKLNVRFGRMGEEGWTRGGERKIAFSGGILDKSEIERRRRNKNKRI